MKNEKETGKKSAEQTRQNGMQLRPDGGSQETVENPDHTAEDAADENTDEETDEEVDTTTDDGTDDSDDEEVSVTEQILGGLADEHEIAHEGEEYIAFRTSDEAAPNSHASRRFFGGYDAVTYIYDEDDNVLYLKPLSEEEADVLEEEHPDVKISRLNSNEDGKVNPFSIKEVIQQFDLRKYFKKNVTSRYYPEWDDDNEAVKLELTTRPETVDYTRSTSDDDGNDDDDNGDEDSGAESESSDGESEGDESPNSDDEDGAVTDAESENGDDDGSAEATGEDGDDE